MAAVRRSEQNLVVGGNVITAAVLKANPGPIPFAMAHRCRSGDGNHSISMAPEAAPACRLIFAVGGTRTA